LVGGSSVSAPTERSGKLLGPKPGSKGAKKGEPEQDGIVGWQFRGFAASKSRIA
jgi:hypothetical protein